MHPLPLRHLSIRVPWHDDGWNGTICKQPTENTACICLGAIHEGRDDRWEEDHKGKPVDEDAKAKKPPCIRERAAFMCPRKLDDELLHKLRHDALYAHFRNEPTAFENARIFCAGRSISLGYAGGSCAALRSVEFRLRRRS